MDDLVTSLLALRETLIGKPAHLVLTESIETLIALRDHLTTAEARAERDAAALKRVVDWLATDGVVDDACDVIAESLHTHTLTLRDYFAGVAMAGVLASTRWTERHAGLGGLPTCEPEARLAYRIADVLLTVRAEHPHGPAR